jgi:predicted RNA-binding protein YlqC (UPF0109 family)
MLARLARTLPEGGYLYEPKWDGFRALAFRDGADVELQSRNLNPFGRYFPELTEALLELSRPRFVLDGEIVISEQAGFDFGALLKRVHPARSRVERLRLETPAAFVAFDLVAEDDDDVDEIAAEGNRIVGGTPKGVLEYVARNIVDDPDGVFVETSERRQGEVELRLHVSPSDMGKVIGRRGRVAQALRQVVAAAGTREGVRASLDIVD